MSAEDDDPRIARALRWTAWGMRWEALARGFWPAFVWGIVGPAALALGAPGPGWAIAAWLAVLLLALGWGVWRLRWPRAAAVRARVDARLAGRPLAALRDRIAVGAGDDGSAALWTAHLARMAEAARAARPVPPHADLARRDRLGLRLVALVALVMALMFGSAAPLGQGFGALASTLRPPASRPSPAEGPGWEGWAAPPEYTRRPTIYLNDLPEDAALTLPKGSRITLRLYGGANVAHDLGATSGEADAPEIVAERSGVLSVGGRRFDVTVLPDHAPVIAAGAAPQRRADGRLVQQFTAADDIGVATAEARIALDLPSVDRHYGLAVDPEPRAALQVDLPLPARGGRTEVSGTLTTDLAKHPLANLPVTLTLVATDGLGQTGTAAPLRTVLPGRRFFDPLAAALIEMRRDLLWSRANAPRTAQLLRAVSWSPEGFMDEPLWRELRGAVDRLEAAPLDDAARDALAETLWTAAVLLEDGGLADALERMQQAQERLSEAIRNGATPDEVQRLMDELKAATDAYTDMLAEQAPDEADRFTKQQPGQRITGDQIQAMMDEIQRLMNEGRMAEAQELLEQFNRMMENLKVTQGGEGEGEGGRGQPQQRLTDTLREQQRLADEAMRQAQQGGAIPSEPGQGQPGEGQPGAGAEPGQEGGDPGAQGGAGQGDLATRQRALRQDLGRQRGLLPGAGTEGGDQARGELDRAGRAMEDAEQALREGDTGAALDRQAEAIEALREGLRALGQMQGDTGGAQPQPGEGQSPGDAPEGPGGDGRQGQQALPYVPRPPTDPLGRALSGNGSSITTGEALAEGGADPAARARDLLGEIRRRLANPERGRSERDYLGRLLDRF